MKKKVNSQSLSSKAITNQTLNFNRTIDSVLRHAGRIIMSLSIIIFAFSISSFGSATMFKKKLSKNNSTSNEKTIKREEKEKEEKIA